MSQLANQQASLIAGALIDPGVFPWGATTEGDLVLGTATDLQNFGVGGRFVRAALSANLTVVDATTQITITLESVTPAPVALATVIFSVTLAMPGPIRRDFAPIPAMPRVVWLAGERLRWRYAFAGTVPTAGRMEFRPYYQLNGV